MKWKVSSSVLLLKRLALNVQLLQPTRSALPPGWTPKESHADVGHEGRRRDDIRVTGSASRGRVTCDCDVKLYSQMAGRVHPIITRKFPDVSNVDHSSAEYGKHLASVADGDSLRRDGEESEPGSVGSGGGI